MRPQRGATPPLLGASLPHRVPHCALGRTWPADDKRLEDIKLRVNEHNVMVVAKYYSRITTARLAELLDLSPDEVRPARGQVGSVGGGPRVERGTF